VGNVVTSSSGSKAEVGMYKFHFDFGRYSLRSYPSLGIEAWSSYSMLIFMTWNLWVSGGFCFKQKSHISHYFALGLGLVVKIFRKSGFA